MTTQTVQPISGTDTGAVAIFDNHDFAAAAVKQRADSGFDIKKVTVVGRNFKDGFLVIVHGTPSEVDRARSILHGAHSTQIDLHEHMNMTLPATARASIT